MENKQQTAVEWLIEQIEKGKIEIVYSDKIHSIKCIAEIIQQAKEMEKQQIVKGITFFKDRPYEEITAEQYIKETYGGNK